MFMHLLNNGFAVVVTYLSSKMLENVETTTATYLSFNQLFVFLILSIMFISVAVLLFKEKKSLKESNIVE